MSKEIINYWKYSLSIISVINICFISYYLVNLRENNIHFYLGICAFIFTIVCAIRAIWLRKDIERVCMYDSKISTPFVGRTLATFAELCYIIIIITILTYIIKDTKQNNKMIIFVKIILPLIIIAEIFSWMGCSTKYELWNSLEEILWFISGLIVFVSSNILYNHITNLKKTLKNNSVLNFLIILIISSFVYLLFMLFNDIPMYIKKWENKFNTKYKNFSLKNFEKDFKLKNRNFMKKIIDMNNCYKISNDYNEWKEEIPWLTGYFTLGVWSCIAMVIWFRKYTQLK